MSAKASQPAQDAAGPPLRPYEQVPESKFELDWADLVTLDLSNFDAPGEKKRLADQLHYAAHNVGFFYITGFGFTQEEVDRQFAIGRDIFALPLEEKMKHCADLATGDYNGYRVKGAVELFPGLRDNIQMYNLYKFIPAVERSQPDIITQHRAEIERFQRHIIGDIVRKLLILFSIIMELPEDFFTQGHSYEDVSDCHLRYMLYTARSKEENEAFEHVYTRGHTDFGSLTLLFRQPIAALQIRFPNGEWKWVKPRPASITVNIADVLQFWTNGYLKSSIHRVITPPEDQAHLDRLGLLFFVRPARDLTLKSIDSPLLDRLGLKREDEAADIKAGDWVKMRVRQNLNPAVDRKYMKTAVVEAEIMKGVKAQFYN